VAVAIPKDPVDRRCREYAVAYRHEWDEQVTLMAHGVTGTNQQRKAAQGLGRFRKGKVPLGVYEQVLGGKLSAYTPIFRRLLEREVDRQHPGREIAGWQHTSVDELDVEYLVAGYFYFVPGATLPDDFSLDDLDIEAVVLTAAEMEARLDQRFELMRRRAHITETKDGFAEPGDAVVCSITGTRGRRPYPPACIKNHTVYTGAVEWESPFKRYADQFVGARKGSNLELDVTWENSDGTKVPVVLHVHVHGVASVRPSTLEELAGRNGHASVEVWRERLREVEVRRETLRIRDLVRTQVIEQARAVATIEPIPLSWIADRAQRLYLQELASVRGDEPALLARYHASSAAEVIAQSISPRFLAFVEELLLTRAMGVVFGVEGTGETLADAERYNAAVWAWVEEHVPVERITTDVIRERRARIEADKAEAARQVAGYSTAPVPD